MPKITKDSNPIVKTDPEKKSTKKTKKASETDTKSVSKKSASSKKKTTSKQAVEKTSRSRAKKEAVTTKASSKGSSSKAPRTTAKKTQKQSIQANDNLVTLVPTPEYYDLPYRYNETIVKVLAQTPTKLFVYWDISDHDRTNYIQQYGSDFFNRTIPVLWIYNETQNYRFMVEIDDFANSWYLPISDDNCKYRIELGRVPRDPAYYIPNQYIPITTSNQIDAPNGHVLVQQLPQKVCFKNWKTQQMNYKDITTFPLYKSMENIYQLYMQLFTSSELEERNNPSSDFEGF